MAISRRPDPAETPVVEGGAAQLATRPVRWWNPANLITILRVVLVPVFVLLLVAEDGAEPRLRYAAAAVFVLAAASDRLDGLIARRYGLITDLGKLLDPIADKLLIGGALIALSWLGDVPWWVTVVILVRELGVTLLRMSLLRYLVLPASRGGKLKTVLQSIAIGAFVLPLATYPDALVWLATAALGVAVGVTVLTGADYALQGIRLHRAGRRRDARPAPRVEEPVRGDLG